MGKNASDTFCGASYAEEFDASTHELYSPFSGGIIASYGDEFDALKYEFYELFSGEITASYLDEFGALKYKLYSEITASYQYYSNGKTTLKEKPPLILKF